MPKWVISILAVLAVAAPTSAGAHVTIIEPMGATRPWNSWVEEDWMPTPAVTISLVENTSGCAVALACTDGYSTLWIMPIGTGKGVLYHELGHIFNYAYLLNYPERQEVVKKLMGHPRLEWGWVESSTSVRTGTEYFADAYSLCARTRTFAASWTYTTGGGFTFGRNLTRLCAYLRRF